MRYFVSYKEVFHSDDLTKRESLRLETYTLLLHFLTRKQIPGNPIIAEFNRFKVYFESHEFTSVYFLSPFIINENQLVKDLMNLIIHSGESNAFDEIFDEVKDEVKTIRRGRNSDQVEQIEVKTADEFIERYNRNHAELGRLRLSSSEEKKILFSVLDQGYKNHDENLSILNLALRRLEMHDSDENLCLIKMGEELLGSYPDNAELYNNMAYLYESPYYHGNDQWNKVYEYFVKGALLNNPVSLYREGLCLFTGQGCRKDPDKALQLWQTSSKMGNSDATCCIGIYYLSKGRKDKAKPYLDKCAEEGDYKALLLLDTDFNRV